MSPPCWSCRAATASLDGYPSRPSASSSSAEARMVTLEMGAEVARGPRRPAPASGYRRPTPGNGTHTAGRPQQGKKATATSSRRRACPTAGRGSGISTSTSPPLTRSVRTPSDSAPSTTPRTRLPSGVVPVTMCRSVHRKGLALRVRPSRGRGLGSSGLATRRARATRQSVPPNLHARVVDLDDYALHKRKVALELRA